MAREMALWTGPGRPAGGAQNQAEGVPATARAGPEEALTAGRNSSRGRYQAQAGKPLGRPFAAVAPVGPVGFGRPGLAGREAQEQGPVGPGPGLFAGVTKVPQSAEPGNPAGALQRPAEASLPSGARTPAGAGIPAGAGRALAPLSRREAGPRAMAAGRAVGPAPFSASYTRMPRRRLQPLLSPRPGLSKWSYPETPCSQPPIQLSFLYGVRDIPSARSA